jgi:Amt family ammonium transporter
MAMEPTVMINTLWVLVAAFLVFFMNAGFAMLESGLCRSKNTVNILAKNFIVFGLSMIAFWSLGYGLMFGEGSSFVGSEGWFLGGLGEMTNGVPTLAFFIFQLTFAVTAATIVSGAVAERIKIHAFMLFALILTAVIYPIIGHWTWGGGWLGEAGFADFAGSTVVHSVGGWAALVGAFLLGPRLGKYDKDGNPRPIPGHNIAYVTLGGFILWLGWFGFNGGSELAVDGALPHIITTTALAAACGGVAATIYAWLRSGKPDLTLIVNGMLAGLVGITAGCNVVPVWGSAIIGGLAGVLVIEAVMFFDRIKIDDPVGATSVHLVCGVFGTLMTGVLGKASLGMANEGLAFGGGMTQVVIQLKGIAAVGGFVLATSAVVWMVLKATMGIRVTEEEEMTGLDLSEMGMEAYPAPHERDAHIHASSPAPSAMASAKPATQEG